MEFSLKEVTGVGWGPELSLPGGGLVWLWNRHPLPQEVAQEVMRSMNGLLQRGCLSIARYDGPCPSWSGGSVWRWELVVDGIPFWRCGATGPGDLGGTFLWPRDVRWQPLGLEERGDSNVCGFVLGGEPVGEGFRGQARALMTEFEERRDRMRVGVECKLTGDFPRYYPMVYGMPRGMHSNTRSSRDLWETVQRAGVIRQNLLAKLPVGEVRYLRDLGV